SGERRVGEEGRSRWAPYPLKKNKKRKQEDDTKQSDAGGHRTTRRQCRSVSPARSRHDVVVSFLSNCHQHFLFFFSSRRRHTRFKCDWSSDVCSSDLVRLRFAAIPSGENAITSASS